MQASPRWRDGRFRNLHPILPGLRDPTLPCRRCATCCAAASGACRPRRCRRSILCRVGLSRRGSGLRATWLGHSTLLLEIDGLRVLTDPVWGARASPSRLAGPKRFQPVPVPLRALPPLDLVLVSHDHYDHLDYPTIRELRKLDVPFVTSLGVGAHLEAWGVPPARIVELDWWESYSLPSCRAHDHRGALAALLRPHARRAATPRCGRRSSFARSGTRVFFSGDTGLTTEYQTIRERLGPFDLVMLEVGAFHPAWGDMHLGPENALKALALLGGGLFCRSTGGPSPWRCTPGTSRPKRCSSSPRARARS